MKHRTATFISVAMANELVEDTQKRPTWWQRVVAVLVELFGSI
ncbi:hypothetical protein [Furfurilactobacillus siliginis]|nr:hypothetical protein [Furfurilactobacillus siliginis]